jgi:hypothetical protein
MDPKTGLYSKAAQIIRGLQQERGTAEQFVGAARKAGLKDVELQHAGELPQGQITRDELADIFEARKPRIQIEQYGENPSYLSRDEHRERIALQRRRNDIQQRDPLSPEEEARHKLLSDRLSASPNVIHGTDEDTGDQYPLDTQYGAYASNDANNYRERLLQLPKAGSGPTAQLEKELSRARDRLQHHEGGYGVDHPVTQQSRDIVANLEQRLEQSRRLNGPPRPQGTYQSSHWEEHPNVLAHIRLSDREIGENRDTVRPIMERLANMAGVGVRDLSSGAVHVGVAHGVITPEEAASVSRVMRWHTPFADKKGIGKRLLHVEELQSDWGQEGRDKGFRSPDKVYRVWDKSTGKTVSEHDTHDQAWDAYRTHPDSDKLDYGPNNAPPPAPYVTNTQHWTDLALKNVLREAALGNYDGIVFPTGQNQADRYGLEKEIKSLSLKRPQDGSSFGRLTANNHNGRPVFDGNIRDAEHLQSLVGRDVAERLLNSDPVVNQNEQTLNHYISGDDLKMGGSGMKTYYDQMVPKSVLKLARQHDPDIQPAEPVTYGEGDNEYQGFHLPMTENLKRGVLDKGYPAFRRGGSVDAALAATRHFTKDNRSAIFAQTGKEI